MRKLFPFLFVIIGIAAVACGGAATTTDESAAPADQPEAAAATTQQAEPDSSSSPDAASPSSTSPPEQRQASVAPSSAASESSDAPFGGVFRRLWADPPTLDPHLTSDTTSAGVVVEIFSGLVALAPDLQLIPDIAERWEISSDGRTYTFHIRDNAKFQDGKQVTAKDFKWSFERAAKPETGSPVADVYLNDIVGVQAVFDGEADDISGVKVIDAQTLQITIDAPKAYFLAKLTYPTAYVLDQDNVEAGGDTWTDSPNGTGPFSLQEYKIGERIVLKRNENFYREKAKLDSVVMNLAGGQSMAMYENDEIDITGVGLFDIDRVLDPNEKLNKDLIVAPPDFSVSYIGFNTSQAPFDDVKFRQALNYAIDKELIAKEVLSDLVVPAYGILPPQFPGYNSNLQGLKFNETLAQQLLAESKYADPDSRPRIVITVPGTGGTIGLDLEVIIEMWRQRLGVEVEIQQVEWATFLQDLDTNDKFQAFAGLGWSADYPDPQDFLDVLFHTESPINHGNYTNAEVDSILERARVEADVQKRIDLYNQAENLIVEDAAWVPLWFGGERHVLVKSKIKGYRVTPMIIPKLKDVYIEN